MKKTISFLFVLCLVVLKTSSPPTFSATAVQTNLKSDKVVVLSDGFVVPEDSTSSSESGLDNDLVQSNEIKYQYQKGNIEGISTYISTEIVDVTAQADGTSLVLLSEYNDSSAAMYSVPYYKRASLLHVDSQGIILASYNIATGVSGTKTTAISSSFTESDYDTISEYAADPKLIESSGAYQVLYTGKDSQGNLTDYVLRVNGDLNFNTITKTTVTNNQYNNRYQVKAYNSSSSQLEDDHIIYASQDTTGADDAKLSIQKLDIANSANASNSIKQLQLPTWEELTGKTYASGSRFIDSEVITTPQGYLIAKIRAFGSSPFPSTSYGIVVWNSDGTIKHQYVTASNISLKLLTDISTDQAVYFQEANTSLKRLNITTGQVELVQSYPPATNLNITYNRDPMISDKYIISGTMMSPSGIFNGYTPGSIVGFMNEQFEVTTVTTLTDATSVSTKVKVNGDNVVVYGNLGKNRDFANQPNSSTNGIGAMGWVNYSVGEPTSRNISGGGPKNDVYIGEITTSYDYAPTINVGKPAILNVDQITGSEQLDNHLLADISVYDSIDLNPNSPNNLGLSSEQISTNLQNRINRSPNDLTANIEWDKLGLDLSTNGVNRVKYFITDSKLQTTAVTRLVSVIDNNTAVDANNQIALDANNIALTLTEAQSIDATNLIQLADAVAWDLTDGTDLTDKITIDSTNINLINNLEQPQITNLELTITHNNITVSKTISVFVGGVYHKQDDIVLFASSFYYKLSDAKNLTNDQVIDLADVQAYYLSSAKPIDKSLFDIDLNPVKAALDVGPYSVTIKVLSTETKVLANLYKSSTIIRKCDAIDAVNIVYSLEQLLKISDQDLETDIISKSHVKAWDSLSGEPVTYTIDRNAIKRQVGTYDVTFSTSYSTTKTIKVFVLDNPTCDVASCDATEAKYLIDAVDFTTEAEQVKDLSSEQVIKLANASAMEISTGNSIVLYVDYSEIIENPGSYDVIFNSKNNLKKTVKATVGTSLVIKEVVPDPDPEPKPEPKSDAESDEQPTNPIKLALSAENVYFDIEELADIDSREELNGDIISRANARIWEVNTNTDFTPKLDSSKVTISAPTAEPITEQITYSSNQAQKIILDENPDAKISFSDLEALSASDISLSLIEVKDLTAEKLLDAANVNGWVLEDLSDQAEIDVDFSKIEAAQGVYPLKFSTNQGTEITVNAFVGKVNRPVITADGYVIYANNISMTTDQVTDNIDKLSEVEIIDQETLTKEPISYRDASMVSNKPGVYTATFGVDVENSASIEVTILSAEPENSTFRKIFLSLLIVIVVILLIRIIAVALRSDTIQLTE